MFLKIMQFTNVFLAALLTGDEAGSKFVVHPAVKALSTTSAQIEAEQALVRGYKPVMAVLMTSTVLSAVPVLRLSRSRSVRSLTLVGMLSYAMMLCITLLGNMPINNQTLAISADTSSTTWRQLRRGWDNLHTIRIILDSIGLGSFLAAALSSSQEEAGQ